ncbi:peptidyl-tRNA hydrolase [Aspergillus cavernicola]|uniref:peptidyl-tRNA hydrolase n=1 Tax=Aspergillus cavernicola TaxID=176166 RepID=A0ABR4I8C3_9EURO
MNPRTLFIASIGNPGRYRNTRHSAGHTLLDALTPLLLTKLPPVYKTWASPSLMNASGQKLIRELESFKRTNTTALTLVILHDELEKPIGKVVVKRGGPEKASLRGHNGLKDIFKWLEKKKLYQQGNNPLLSVLRIGVGIGRPDSRSPEDVANYVLSKMDGGELDAVKRAAVSVVDILAEEIGGK